LTGGAADAYCGAEVSQAVNDRYAEALASLDTTTPLGPLAATVCRPLALPRQARTADDGKWVKSGNPASAIRPG
jgi:hypothetical protein